jgi:hypothetical protein
VRQRQNQVAGAAAELNHVQGLTAAAAAGVTGVLLRELPQQQGKALYLVEGDR